MSRISKLKEKIRCNLAKKSNGDGNLLVACLLVVAGVIIAQIIYAQVQNAGVQIHTTLNDKVKATSVANTWVK